MAAESKTIILDFELDVAEAVESINDLTAANKKLREERNKLNIASEAGKKRAQEINAVIDQNTQKIKANVSAIEQQKINIGNYKSALDGVNPAFGKLAGGLEQGTQGFKAMTLQALRFIATPIGAILAALVAVFMLLKTAISSNNQILDKFENVTNAIGVVLNVLIKRVALLGEALIAFATGDFAGAINKTAEAFTGLGDAIANSLKQGQLYLDLSRELEDAQRSLRIETSKQENEIKRLVVASKNRNLSLAESEAMLRRALALEEQLVAKRADNAFKDLVLTAKQIALDKQLQQTSEETFDQFVNRLITGGILADNEVDAIIDKIEALEQARGSSLAFQEKVENQLSAIQLKRAEAIKKQTEAMAEQEAQERALKRAQSGGDTGGLSSAIALINAEADLQIDAEMHKAETIAWINERLSRDLAKINKQRADQEAAQAERSAELAAIAEEQKLEAAIAVTGGILGLLDEQSAAYRGVATAQTLISTYSAATKAYEAAFLPVPTVASPALGVLFAAAAVANGLANVARINGVEFAEGGWTGPGGKWDVAGVVHADEYVVPKSIVNNPAAAHHVNALERMRLAPYADGGLATRSISTPVNQSLEIANAFKNMPPMELDVREVTRKQNRIKVKEKISRI
jgi:hypothetical protein